VSRVRCPKCRHALDNGSPWPMSYRCPDCGLRLTEDGRLRYLVFRFSALAGALAAAVAGVGCFQVGVVIFTVLVTLSQILLHSPGAGGAP